MAVLGVPLINGVEYSHADIVLNIGGVPIIGLTAITYGDSQAVSPNFSTGHYPTSVGFGPVTCVGTLTLTMAAMELIVSAAPNGIIQNLPFIPIGINYLPEGGILVRHRLENVKMMSRNMSSQAEGTQIENTIDLFISRINWKA